MGRPLIFTPPVNFPWAQSTPNYPAGPNPWNAQPITVAPPGDYFTPNTYPAAQNFNYILQQLGNTDAAVESWAQGNEQHILDWTGAGPANNWKATQLTTDIVTNMGVSGDTVNHGLLASVWSPQLRAWISLLSITHSATSEFTLAITSGVDDVYSSANGQWNNYSTTRFSADHNPFTQGTADIAIDSFYANRYHVAYSLGPGAGFKVVQYDQTTDTWTTEFTATGFTVQNLTLVNFGLFLVLGVTESTGAFTIVYSSPWANATSSYTSWGGNAFSGTGKWYFKEASFSGFGTQIYGVCGGTSGNPGVSIMSPSGGVGTWSQNYFGSVNAVVNGLGVFLENNPAVAITGTPGAQGQPSLVTYSGKSIYTSVGGTANWASRFNTTNTGLFLDLIGMGSMVVGLVKRSVMPGGGLGQQAINRGGSGVGMLASPDDTLLLYSTNSGINWNMSPFTLRDPGGTSGDAIRLVGNGPGLFEQSGLLGQLVAYRADSVRMSHVYGSGAGSVQV